MTTPPTATMKADRPTETSPFGSVEPGNEHQEDDAQLGEPANELIALDDPERRRADEQAGDDHP